MKKRLSRTEFDQLDLSEKIEYLQGTDLWECINENYHILRCDEGDYLDEEIDDYIEYYSSSWQDLLSDLSAVKDLLDNLCLEDWIYRDAYCGISDYCELTIETFNEIVDVYKETEAYNETFTVLNFDDVEELL